MMPIRLAIASIVVAATIYRPDAMAQQSSVPPPPPGFGEPLSPGPYVFFVDYRGDWAGIVERVRAVVEVLPKSVWKLCYVQSFDASKRRRDKVQARGKLQVLLRKTGMARLDVVKPESCKMEPRELDALHLFVTSNDRS